MVSLKILCHIISNKLIWYDIKLYDVIAYRNDTQINIIHRIIDIDYGLETKYVTRGDVYDSSKTDSYRPVYEDIIGRYTGKRIPGVGIFILFLQSYAGIITVLSLVYCLIMIDSMSNKINKVQAEREEKLQQAMDYSSEQALKDIKQEFKETIYYKGYAYTFDENGFIDKEEITDNSYLEKSNDVLIKEIKNKEEVATEEVVINNNNESEK